MTQNRILHFTFGPVQGFVAQARRTRDLWAGSYLLSYLAGCAMHSLELKLAPIVFPDVSKDPLLASIRDHSIAGRQIAAQVGSLPNRFKAMIPDPINGDIASEAIKRQWTIISDKVREKVDSHKQIIDDNLWKKQISNTWDCYWAIGEGDYLLNLRKNIRTHFPPPEFGETCTLCGERQEISGKLELSRTEINQWWKTNIRKKLGEIEIRERERLCAVCLTKRLFPHVSKEAIGWDVPKNFPSVSYMAAIGWIRRVLNECAEDSESAVAVRNAVDDFVIKADATGVSRSETETRITGISEAIKQSRLQDRSKHFIDLDGSSFFEASIANDREFPINEDPLRPDAKRKTLIEALNKLQNALPPKSGLASKAAPFYALLVMDGDGMGRMLSTYPDLQGRISSALLAFSASVPGIVQQQDGRLIYAGGDDVLAILPIDRALPCAAKLREAYQGSFCKVVPEIPRNKATISGAIEYAHIHAPLGSIVKDAHDLLDREAKERCGRDGLACRVWKPGGPALTWSQPWSVILNLKDLDPALSMCDTLVDAVRLSFEGGEGDGTRFSSKFFYRIRDLFDLLQSGGAAVRYKDALKLLAAEYLSSRNLSWTSGTTPEEKRAKAEARMKGLFRLCRRQMRKLDDNGEASYSAGALNADGALLVRFLSQKEV